jgi:hypothetical protein
MTQEQLFKGVFSRYTRIRNVSTGTRVLIVPFFLGYTRIPTLDGGSGAAAEAAQSPKDTSSYSAALGMKGARKRTKTDNLSR